MNHPTRRNFLDSVFDASVRAVNGDALPVFTELPGSPTNLGISNIGPRSVTLQFRPGYDGKTSISRWQVEAQVSNGCENGQWQEFSISSLS